MADLTVTTVSPAVGSVPPVTTRPADAPVATPPVTTPGDSVRVSAPPKGTVPATPALAAPTGPARTTGEQPAASPAADKPNPWRVKSVNVDYGLMYDVRYSHSDIHLQRPGQGTDVVLHDVGAHDRTSAAFLYSMPNGFPQPDEPQYDAGVAVKFENDWGVEFNVKHNKYVVMTSADPDQQVRMTGTVNGQAVDEVRSLKSVMPEYQITNGLNEFSLLASRSFELPAPGRTRLTYNLKAGPSVYLPYTKSTMVNADGTEEHREGPFHISGFGAMAEQSLRYEIPVSQHSAISTELLHAVTVAHVPNSLVAGGHASQTVAANQLGLTVGYTYTFGK